MSESERNNYVDRYIASFAIAEKGEMAHGEKIWSQVNR